MLRPSAGSLRFVSQQTLLRVLVYDAARDELNASQLGQP